MNPLRLMRIYRKANKVADLMEEANMKALWKSKTFWFNLLTASAELAQVIPLPPGTVTIAVAVINIGLRVVTDKPVSLTGK